MKRRLATLGLITVLSGLAIAQDAAKTPAFEAADVHVSAPGTSDDQGISPDGRMEFHGATLLRLISFAYSMQPDRITGGPSWIDVDRYDVIAKTAAGTSNLAMRTMLQGLLMERFGLSVKNEDKPQPVYALVLGKHGPKESSGEGDSKCNRAQEEGMLTLTCHHTTIATLAEQLPRSAPAYFDRPVVDRTGLKGAYDFKLSWVGRAQLPPGSEGKSLHIFSSVEKQLDIKIEPQTAPMPVLSVDKVNRTPSPNPPGVAEALGAAPTEFEVVEIKPSRPDEKQEFNMRNGRIDARAVTLKELIGFAYEVDEDDMVRGGEKWLDTDHFNILAKTVPLASTDNFRTMVRAMLADRFKLKAHKEPQPVNVFALTAVKPKMKEADPSERSTCKAGALDGARYYTCQNTTMKQLAEKIGGQVAGGYVDRPVVDLTGLTGAYDFTLTWAPVALTRGGGGGRVGSSAREGGSPGGDPTSSDPTGGLTVFQAIERQLGLKLAPQKHPLPVVVVDHIERLPTEN